MGGGGTLTPQPSVGHQEVDSAPGAWPWLWQYPCSAWKLRRRHVGTVERLSKARAEESFKAPVREFLTGQVT